MSNIYINKETGEEVELLRIDEDWMAEKIYKLKPVKKKYVEGAIIEEDVGNELIINYNIASEETIKGDFIANVDIPTLARTIIQMSKGLDWVNWVTYDRQGLYVWEVKPKWTDELGWYYKKAERRKIYYI